MRDGQAFSEGEQIVSFLMNKLEVKREDLIADAYIDLFLRQQRAQATTRQEGFL